MSNLSSAIKKCLYLCAVLVVAAVVWLVAGDVPANAAVYTYERQDIEIDLPDDTIVVTPDTLASDALWRNTGVADPAAFLKDIEQRGVVAAFYDINSKMWVYFFSKSSNPTIEEFTFVDKSDDEIVKFMSDIMATTDEGETDITPYRTDKVNFFRLQIVMPQLANRAIEVIYGTVLNAKILEFDIYAQDTNEIDDTFLKRVADGVKITRIISREEYEAEARAMLHKFFWILGGIAGFVVILIIIAVVNKKYRKKKSKRIAEIMGEFREKRRNNPEEEEKMLFITHTVYDDNAISNFVDYTMWLKHVVMLVIWSVLLIVMIVIMLLSQATKYAVFVIVAVVAVLYFTYSRGQKLKKALNKQYSTKDKKTAICRFCEDYFTVAGIGALSEFIYPQIMCARRYKDCIYLYTSEENAVIVDITPLGEEKAAQLMAHVKSHMKFEMNPAGKN